MVSCGCYCCAPHSGQNFAPGWSFAPHFVHAATSFFSSLSPDMDFLNSRIPLPISFATFGNLFAPKMTSTIRKTNTSSQGPMLPKKARFTALFMDHLLCCPPHILE